MGHESIDLGELYHLPSAACQGIAESEAWSAIWFGTRLLKPKGVLRKVGKTGRSAHYVLARKQDVMRTNRTFDF